MKYTPEQLQEFTDAELSQAVLLKTNDKVLRAWPVEVSSTVFGETRERMGACSFDINNWSDMGALANKNGIGSTLTFAGWNAHHFDVDGYIEFDATCENELRAKAIVFLLMEI